jgi:hypothetical protein
MKVYNESEENNWLNSNPEEESNLPKVRVLNISDFNPIPGLGKEQAMYYCSMSCKIVLSHPERESWTEDQIAEALAEKYPTVYPSQYERFFKIFNRVLELRPIWMMGYQKPTKKASILPNRKQEILKQISELLKELADEC